MQTSLRFLVAIAALSLLSACGGGGGGGTIPSSSGPTAKSGQASLQFFIPSASSSVSSSSRGAHALPSSTQSVQILVLANPVTASSTPISTMTFNVSAGGTGCQPATGGFTCTETVSVPVGQSLLFNVLAYAGPNATGAELANGNAVATIGSTTTGVNITVKAQNIYVGSSMSGGIGTISVDHSANTFTVNSANGKTTSGTVSALPNGDLKLVVTAATGGSANVGDIVYAREIQGSVFIFADTGFTTVQANGANTTGGGDMGAAVAAQGCPTAASSQTVSVANVPGPAWAVATSNAYESGTAAVTLSGGTATLNFTGSGYLASGATGTPQSGTQVCSGGIFTGTASQGSVAFSPDNIAVVTNGSNGNPTVTDTEEGSFGFAESTTPSTAAIAAGTYDGFIGGLGIGAGTVVGGETPFQITPLSPSMMNVCQYSNFEAGTVGTTCGTVTFGANTAQPGVILVTVNAPGQPTTSGAVVVGTTSSGKFVMFGTVSNSGTGGNVIAFLQH